MQWNGHHDIQALPVLSEFQLWP